MIFKLTNRVNSADKLLFAELFDDLESDCHYYLLQRIETGISSYDLWHVDEPLQDQFMERFKNVATIKRATNREIMQYKKEQEKMVYHKSHPDVTSYKYHIRADFMTKNKNGHMQHYAIEFADPTHYKSINEALEKGAFTAARFEISNEQVVLNIYSMADGISQLSGMIKWEEYSKYTVAKLKAESDEKFIISKEDYLPCSDNWDEIFKADMRLLDWYVEVNKFDYYVTGRCRY